LAVRAGGSDQAGGGRLVQQKGETGAKNATSATGEKGETGAKGVTGATGEKAKKGEKGVIPLP
jgi:hypothetical protein